MEKEIAKYSYIMVIALILSSFFNYLYQVVMGILLPKHEFGILGVALSIFCISSVLTQNTFSWSGTRRMASSQTKEIPKVFRTTLAGNLTLAVIASLLILYYSYKSKTYLIPNTLIIIALILSAFTNSYASFLRAMKKFAQLANAGIMSAFLKLLFGVILVMLGTGVIGGVAAILISIAAVLAYLAYNASKIKLPSSKGFVKEMIPETFFVSIIFLGITFIVNSSIIFTRWLSGSDVLAGDYNAALTIARGPFFITGALISVLFPYISSPNNKRWQYAFQSIKYIALLVFPICISMAVDPETWLNLFFGRKYISASYILRILSMGMGFICFAYMISSNLVAFERFKIPAACLLIASFSQIFIVYSLNYNPALASAFSVVASSIIAASILFIHYTRKFYFKSSARYILKIIIAYSILSLAFLVIHSEGRILSLVEIAISFSIYLALLSMLKLFDEKDVDTLLSPLPKQLVKIVKKVVIKLNSLNI